MKNGKNDIRVTTKKENVHIALSSSDLFVPILIVCLYSLAKNTSSQREYDITVLQTNISSENQERILSVLAAFPNINLRFLDVSNFLENKAGQVNGNITVQTFFRLLLPFVLPEWEKTVYLDSDIIVLRDIGLLYDEEFNDAYLLATHDADGTAQFNGSLPWMKDYGKKALHLRDQTDYFQAGVLVMNLTQLRSSFSLEQMLTLVEKNYVYFDQDILNRLCEGKVGFLDMRWNVMMDCGDRRRQDISRYAPQAHAEAYQQSREDPWIIHFAGEPKPWQKEHVDYETVFWEYAKGCGEAPMLQSSMRDSTGPGQEQYYTAAHRFISKLSPSNVVYRFFTDVLCPRGSLRFEYLKNVYHKTLMRKRYRQNGW